MTNKNKKRKNKLLSKVFLSLAAALLMSSFSFSNAQTAGEGIPDSYIKIILIIGFVLTLLAFSFLFYYGMGEEKPEPKINLFGFLKKFKEHLVSAVPVEKENEILLEDDYDGIKELDNKIPPWFNYLFYATVIFGVFYMLNYYVFKTGKLQYQEYKEEVQAANIQKAELMKTGAFVNENTVTRLTDALSLNAGKNIFKTNCVACHGPDGGGIVGPNLTDDYWIHGGGIKNIFTTIKYGVPAKGMISWQTQLNPKQIQEAASFVMSLHGTHPANPKPPQGDKYVEPMNSTTLK